jgi:hypothetical protein
MTFTPIKLSTHDMWTDVLVQGLLHALEVVLLGHLAAFIDHLHVN